MVPQNKFRRARPFRGTVGGVKRGYFTSIKIDLQVYSMFFNVKKNPILMCLFVHEKKIIENWPFFGPRKCYAPLT